MFDKIADVMPKALAVSAVVWAAASYTVLGPEVGSRILRADHMPKCQAGFGEDIRRRAEAAIRSIPSPTPDPQKEAAAKQLRELQNSPLAQLAQRHPLAGPHMGQMNSAIEAYEAEKRAARAAYDDMVRRVRDATQTHLGKAGDYCGCLADASIESARTEFAVMAGTFGLVRPAKVRALDDLLAQQQAKGQCSTLKTGV